MKYFLIVAMIFLFSCRKSSFLDQKPSSQILIPTTIKHFQAILDNIEQMNNVIPFLGEAGADNYFCFPDPFESLSPENRNIYLWQDDIWTSSTDGVSYNWSMPYAAIFNCNVVLEGLEKLEESEGSGQSINEIRGRALFFRAYYFFHLAQIFSNYYDEDNSNSEKLGIPIRLKADINEKLFRPSLEVTYQRILNDLSESVKFLPQMADLKNRPSKASAFAFLARVYLVIGEHDASLLAASQCLKIKSDLLDFNYLDSTEINPIKQYNDEVILSGILLTTVLLPGGESSVSAVDSNIYNSYHADDLRKAVFFQSNSNNSYYFKGSYDGTSSLFAGLAVDEVYLTRAECYAYKGLIAEAMDDLNRVMVKRWRKNNFVPFSASSAEEALAMILEERRKELIFRGLRWSDLRRLNDKGASITLERQVEGSSRFLNPNSKSYTYLIPLDVIRFNSGMPQNDR